MKIAVRACVLLFCVCLSAVADDTWTPVVQFMSESAVPPVLCAPKTDTPPTLDGKLDDAAWKNAGVIENINTLGGDPAKPRTTVRITWDDKHIYVACDMEEPHMDRVRVTAAEGEDKWPGDCVEVFFDVSRQRKHYYQFVTNSKGARNDYLDSGRWWDGKWQVKSAPTATGWATEMAIPWADFSIQSATPEAVWGLNITRERELVESGDSPRTKDLHTWAPMTTFGNPHLFGAIYWGTAERYAHYQTSLKLRATLDRHVYNQFHPTAQLAADVIGRGAGSTLNVALNSMVTGQTVARTTVELKSSQLGLDIPIAGLPEGQYMVVAQAVPARGESSTAATIPFTVRKSRQPATSGEIRIEQSHALKQGVNLWHARTGVPFPEGALWDPSHVELRDAKGTVIPAAAQTLATWSRNGSIKWLALDFALPLGADTRQKLTLRYGPDIATSVAQGVKIDSDDNTIRVDTGAARFVIRRKGFNLIDELWVGGRQIIAANGAGGPYMADEKGNRFMASKDDTCEVIVEEHGPRHAIIRAEGWHADERGHRLGRHVVRMYLYADTTYARVQHTFIIAEDTNQTRYSDIALAIPMAGSDYRFGVTDGALSNGKSVSLLQRKWDQYVVHSPGRFPESLPGTADSPVIASGDKAPGIIARGELAVIVRDFWQNFPKELQATHDQLIVHFWPEHGQRVWTEQDEVKPEHAYLFPYVHQGKLLDFKFPKSYLEGPLSTEHGFSYPDGKGGWKLHYGAGAAQANAMGVGKTHDMLLVFGEAASGDAATALNSAFQSGPHFIADPVHISATRVAGPMHPVDPKQFPRQEKWISDGFDFLMKWTLDMTKAFGMFNYGDSYHVAIRNSPDLRPGYYRLWAGYHHGRARIPWLFYLRSGEQKYLDWARANTQHLMDVDTCHYTNSDATNWPEAARKLVGGMCDYKGIVHWHTGSRVGDYNSMIDFLQFDYYLTGNRRALDVMHESGELLIKHAQGGDDRHAQSLGALFHYYQHTWNPAALLRFTRELPRCYVQPAIRHDPPSIGWGPYIEPWVTYSGDPQAKQFLLDFTDLITGEGWKQHISQSTHHYGDGRALAFAYEVTGDRKYLAHAWGFYNRGPATYTSPGDPTSGLTDWLDFSYETQQCLPVMAMIASLDKPLTVEQINYTNGRSSAKVWLRRSSQQGEMRINLLEARDGEFEIGGRFFTRRDIQYELLNPNGKASLSGIITPSAGRLRIIQPRDGIAGEYVLRVFGPDEYLFETTAVSNLGTQRFMLTSFEDGEFLLGGRLFFFVPADCQKFSFRTRGSRESSRGSSVEVVTPDDRVLHHVSLPGLSAEQTIEVVPPPEMRGKVWSIAATQVPILGVEGIEPWFAATVQGALPRPAK